MLLRLKPKLVAFTHVSNTLGTINPVAEMTRAAHEAGALVLIDGAQAVPHVPVDVQAHRRRLLRVQRPQDARADRVGRAVGAARAARGDAAVHGRRRHDPRGPPPPVRVERHPVEVRGGHAGHRGRDRARRGGGVSRATSGWTACASTSASSLAYAFVALPREHPDIELYGPLDPELRGGVIPFNVPGVHPHDVAQVLDRSGVAVRAGHHCTMPLHERLELAATARARFNVYTTEADIDALVAGLHEVKRLFGG